MSASQFQAKKKYLGKFQNSEFVIQTFLTAEIQIFWTLRWKRRAKCVLQINVVEGTDFEELCCCWTNNN
jgi:hypothetical protein